jgi:hypothetical protein
MDDTASGLREANEHFYQVLESLDLAAMQELWLRADWVRCIHPGWEGLSGWTAVAYSWEQIFANTRWLRVTPTGVETAVVEPIGIVSCSENISSKQNEDVGLAVAQATNVFLRTPAGWRMIVHHASPATVLVTEPFSGMLQ